MDQELNTRRTKEFFKQTNALLTECFMHELIIQNPYEAFLMKCILTDDPREIYTNVIETLIPVSEDA